MVIVASVILGRLAAAMLICQAAGGESPRIDGEKPEADVRAVLSKCVACHRGEEPTGGLDLTSRESALRGGESGPALNLEKPKESLIVRKVAARKMPPKSPLSAEQVAALQRWIERGAEWDGTIQPAASEVGPRWAFAPLTRPEPPRDRVDGSRTPVDAFVRDRLRREGLALSPPADRRSLARRLAFDLTGLPLSPDDMEAFVRDPSPKAYEALVDRLLASPAYGERWARHWLDVARFGESHGFEYDRIRNNAWPYRDYVIRSLNSDKPYLDFIREQIAGDLMPDATPETVAATGFLVAGPWDEANNAQSSATMRARTREEEIEDMVAAVGQTFLGVTVNCARCHDHKFDPIPQRDYYRVASALAGVKHGERPAIGASEIARREAERSRIRGEIAEADRAIAEVEKAGRERAIADGQKGASSGPVPLLRWSFDVDEAADSGGITSRLNGGATVSGGALRLSGKGAFLSAGPLPRDLREKTLEAWASIPDPDQRGGATLSVEARGGGQFDAIVYGERQPRKWMAGSEGFVRSKDLDAPVESKDAGKAVHVAIAYDADGTIRIYRDGRPYAPPYRPEKSARTYAATDSEILVGLRHTGAGNGFFAGEIDEVRIFDRSLSAEEVAESFRNGPGGVSLKDVLARLSAPEKERRDGAVRRREELSARLRDVEPLPLVYAANPVEPGPSHLLLRGDVEKKGDLVSAGGLAAVSRPSADFGLDPAAPEAARRRHLADWIANRDNPLTYRVMANRLWHYHFGTGFVGTPSDLGASGERPSHPELLDWLACELRDGGGRLKPLHRLIVTSDTYRQSSRFDAAAAARDADARLLWRFPPRRLEGEAVRDAMLAASGGLNPAMFGPGFRPFTVTVFNSNIYTMTDPIGPEFNRRTIYRIHVLSAKSPLLETLDCPDPAVKTPRRGVTTTPLQALAMMNDSFVIRQARALADRTKCEGGDDPATRVDRAYRLALGRPPTGDERGRAIALAKEHGMVEVAWALLNATEFVYVY